MFIDLLFKELFTFSIQITLGVSRSRIALDFSRGQKGENSVVKVTSTWMFTMAKID